MIKSEEKKSFDRSFCFCDVIVRSLLMAGNETWVGMGAFDADRFLISQLTYLKMSPNCDNNPY